MTDLFVEILCGEIPSRMQKQGAQSFKDLVLKGLESRGLSFRKAEVFYTPRRLALWVEHIPLRTQDQKEEKKGPRVDAPEAAITGFLKSLGLTREQCEVRSLKGVDFLFAQKFLKGQETRNLLPEIIREALFSIPWPKSMRWGNGTVPWVRPIHSGVCIFGKDPVEFEIPFGEVGQGPLISFGSMTHGHRFMGTQAPFKVEDFETYQRKLKQEYVLLNPEARREKILKDIEALLEGTSLVLKEDEGLLEEIVGLVEWPVPLLGHINKDFMKLPPEVLMTSMRVHQRYFSLKDKNGHLAPYFICVANIEPTDKGETLLKGNQRVLTARLSDAQFFYEVDQEISLKAHAQGLQKMTFHAKLGSLQEKAERVAQLASFIARELGEDSEKAKTAGLLCKADLGTKMVYEFPELQGIMGFYYAKDSYDLSIAEAIKEHYQPRDTQDNLPSSILGQIIALADRIDTLVGFFSIQIRPTGSKDPFALRRAALGLIRLLEHKGDLLLTQVFEEAYKLYHPRFKGQEVLTKSQLVEELHNFLLDRLKVYWRETGWRHDYITSAFGLSKSDPLWVLRKRIEALHHFLRTDAGENLLASYRRATNIVKVEEKKDQTSFEGKVEASLFKEPIEREVYGELTKSDSSIQVSLKKKDFTGVMQILSDLRPLIDLYFEKIRVNSENPEERRNRLETLAMIRHTLHQVADFSKIESD